MPKLRGKSALGYEIAQEQAAALGRLGRALEAALAALSRHDHAATKGDGNSTNRPSPTGPLRERLVREASDALWCFVSFSGRLVAFATKGRSFANTAFRRKCGTVWVRSAQGRGSAPGLNEFTLF
jgi:hypothetical protein